MSNDTRPAALSAYLLILIPVAIMTAGQIFSKMGADLIAAGGGYLNGFVILGYAMLVVRGAVWVFILSRLKLLFAYPLMSSTYVIVLAVAAGLFDEVVTASNIAGSLLIMSGITMLSLGERELRRRG
jgi:undecaprenyl phosphate-alpha-L-ara4N flippase subunit ArnE